MNNGNLLITKHEPSANKYLPVPFDKREVVKYLGENPTPTGNDVFDSQFIQIYRMKYKRTEVMSRRYFIDAKTKQPI